MRATYSTKHHMTEMTGPMENWNGLANMEQRTNLEVTALPGSYIDSTKYIHRGSTHGFRK